MEFEMNKKLPKIRAELFHSETFLEHVEDTEFGCTPKQMQEHLKKNPCQWEFKPTHKIPKLEIITQPIIYSWVIKGMYITGKFGIVYFIAFNPQGKADIVIGGNEELWDEKVSISRIYSRN